MPSSQWVFWWLGDEESLPRATQISRLPNLYPGTASRNHPTYLRSTPRQTVATNTQDYSYAPHKVETSVEHFQFPKHVGSVSSLTWQDRVDNAETEEDVLRVARDYLARLDHWEIKLLPKQCAPRKLKGAADLSSYAVDLVRHSYDAAHGTEDFVHRLAAFFTHASMRLAQVTTTPLTEQDDDDEA
jgi:hypothetical protein